MDDLKKGTHVRPLAERGIRTDPKDSRCVALDDMSPTFRNKIWKKEIIGYNNTFELDQNDEYF